MDRPSLHTFFHSLYVMLLLLCGHGIGEFSLTGTTCGVGLDLYNVYHQLSTLATGTTSNKRESKLISSINNDTAENGYIVFGYREKSGYWKSDEHD